MLSKKNRLDRMLILLFGIVVGSALSQDPGFLDCSRSNQGFGCELKVYYCEGINLLEKNKKEFVTIKINRELRSEWYAYVEIFIFQSDEIPTQTKKLEFMLNWLSLKPDQNEINFSTDLSIEFEEYNYKGAKVIIPKKTQTLLFSFSSTSPRSDFPHNTFQN
jgi:hypothetical protein